MANKALDAHDEMDEMCDCTLGEDLTVKSFMIFFSWNLISGTMEPAELNYSGCFSSAANYTHAFSEVSY